MKKLALLTVLALILLAATGVAEGLLNRYLEQTQPNGDILCVFGEATVTLPAEWAGKYVVLPRGDSALFCQAASNRLWKEREGLEDGGLLFALNVDPGTDYRVLPAYLELGDGAWGHYFLSFPTDAQAYAEEAAALEEYRQLSSGLDYVKQNAYVHARLAEGGDGAGMIAFDERSADYEGTWVPFEDGFRLYLPSDWRSYEITGEQAATGLFYRAGSQEGEVPMGVAVSYMEAGELATPEDLMADFEAVGFSRLRQVVLNGIPAVTFEQAGDGYRGVAFYHPEYPGYVLAVYVTPLAEAGTAAGDTAEAILNSLSPWSVEYGDED